MMMHMRTVESRTQRPDVEGVTAFFDLIGMPSLVIGLGTVVWPTATTFAIAWMVGAHLIVAIVSLSVAVHRSRAALWWTRVAFVCILIVVAVMTLSWPYTPVDRLAILGGAGLIASGVVDVVVGATRRLRLPTLRWWTACGLVGVALGATALMWNDITEPLLATLVGVYLFANGSVAIAAAWRLQHQADRRTHRARSDSVATASGERVQPEREALGQESVRPPRAG